MTEGNLPTEAHTQRLSFLPVSPQHITAFYAAFEESFANLTGYYIPAWSRYDAMPPLPEMQAFLQRTEEEWRDKNGFLFSIFDRQTGEFIGQGEIHHMDWSVPKARLGYWVRDRQQGKGYATEIANFLTCFGFDQLGCKRLEIRSEKRNPASAAIADKLGYKHVAVFENNKQGKPGDFWDLVIHARLDKNDLPALPIEWRYP